MEKRRGRDLIVLEVHFTVLALWIWIGAFWYFLGFPHRMLGAALGVAAVAGSAFGWVLRHHGRLKLVHGITEEIRATPLGNSSLVDGASLYLGRNALLCSLPWLALASLLWRPGLGELIQATILAAGFSLWMAYDAQVNYLWSGGRPDGLLGRVMCAVSTLPAGLCLGMLWWKGVPLLSSFLVASALGLGLARAMAVLGVHLAADVRQTLASSWKEVLRRVRIPHPRRLFQLLTSNPVSLREFDRQANQSPGGFLVRLLVSILLCSLLHLTMALIFNSTQFALILLPGSVAWRLALSTTRSDLDEEAMALLKQTGLRSPEYVDGLALSSCFAETLSVATALALLPLVVASLEVGPALLLWAVVLLFMPFCAAYAGVLDGLVLSQGYWATLNRRRPAAILSFSFVLSLGLIALLVLCFRRLDILTTLSVPTTPVAVLLVFLCLAWLQRRAACSLLDL